MRPILATALLALTAVPALADAEYDRCIADADGTNTAYAACGGDWIKRADDQLNAAWRALKPEAEADDEVYKALLAEQRAWNDYKEKSCLFLATGWFGREGQAISYPDCRASVIEARTSELKDYLDRFSEGQ
jgi:uncharacterized protein YecT (DUF1311 family)